jgi:hypothetical protein
MNVQKPTQTPAEGHRNSTPRYAVLDEAGALIYGATHEAAATELARVEAVELAGAGVFTLEAAAAAGVTYTEPMRPLVIAALARLEVSHV